MPQESVLIIDDRRDTVRFLRQDVLDAARYRILVAHDGQEGVQKALEEQPDLIIINLDVSRSSGLRVLEGLRRAGAEMPVLLLAPRGAREGAARAYQLGARQYIVQPAAAERVQRAVEESLTEGRLRTERDQFSHSASAASLKAERRLREMSVLAGISKSVNALLDEDRLMGRVIDAAVYLTAAQEGCLFLLDEGGGELYVRAGRGGGEELSRQPRSETEETLAWQVVHSGKPVIVSGASQQEPSEAQEGHPVKASIHAPLKVGGRVLGVLSVERTTQDRSFSSHDLQLLSALADSAAIALDHGRLRASLRECLEAQLSLSDRPPMLEQDDLARSASLQSVLDGLESYRAQVRTCIESARTILTDLREQAVSLETRLAGISSPEMVLTSPEDVTGAAPVESSERRLRAILDNISDGILVVGGDDRVELANQAASVLLGRALTGQHVEDVCTDPRWSKTYRIVRAAGQIKLDAPGSDLTSATTALASEQHVLRALFRARPSPDRAPAGMVIVLRDITSEREAERAKDSFVASISQELRTPMTSIDGYADLLMSQSVGSLSDAQLKLVHRIRANAQQIDSLMNDLVGMAILDSRQLQLKDEVVDLAAAIHEACATMRAQMADKDQIIELNLDPNLPVVQADPDAMFHVLTNLLQNAYRSSPRGSRIVLRAIKMRDPAVDGDALYAAVSVTDRGGGIAPEDHRRVFNRFYRLDNPVVPGLGDPGVNLPIVKVLVEANGGRVWLDSTPGVGSTVTLVLPVRRNAPPRVETV
jgi:PAS domain S-box-containing protein